MDMKEYLQKVVSDKEAQISALVERSEASTDINEVRGISKQVDTLKAEISEARAQMASVQPAFEPLKALGAEVEQRKAVQDDDMEYRTAFMNYVQKGEMSPVLVKRSDDRITAGDLGVLLPQTVIQDIIKGVEGVYGQLYSRVKKTAIRGGVKYPIGSFSATFHRLVEEGSGSAPSARQAGGAITGYVEFSYNIGEVRIAQSLLASIMSVPVFEEELTKTLVQAYIKAMDTEIMTGVSASNQCEGILTEAAKVSSRIPSANIIEFNEDEVMDWTEWQSKLFSVIPLGMRGMRPEFVMTPGTYEGVIKSLADDNNRPVYYETFNPVDGAERATFKGREVVFVEEDILGTFADISVAGGSTDSPFFGMLWVPEKAYAINSNLEFSVKKYFDEEKNETVNKLLVVNDGKVLDGQYIYLLKKVAKS